MSEPTKDGVAATARDRLPEVIARRDWCEGWLARAHVRRPAITQEWINLLEDVGWLIDEIERLRDASS